GLSFDAEGRRSVLLLLRGSGGRSPCHGAARRGGRVSRAHCRRAQIPHRSLRRPATFHQSDLGSRSGRGDFPARARACRHAAGGPAVHLVKRFEGAAQAGQILVSESCQSLSAGLVTFKSLPPKKMEGFPAPVPCYELVEISGLSRWRARSTKGLSSFVGRTEE